VVLMNSPIIVSTPSISAGRPDTTDPKTTSSALLYLHSSIPQAAWMIVLIVTPFSRDTLFSRRVLSLDIDSSREAGLNGDNSSDAVSRFGSVAGLSYPSR